MLEKEKTSSKLVNSKNLKKLLASSSTMCDRFIPLRESGELSVAFFDKGSSSFQTSPLTNDIIALEFERELSHPILHFVP